MNNVYKIFFLLAFSYLKLNGQNIFTFEKDSRVIIYNFPYNDKYFKEIDTYNPGHMYLNIYKNIEIEIFYSRQTIDPCDISNESLVKGQSLFEDDMKTKGYEIVSDYNCINKWNKNTYTVYGKGIIKRKYFCNLKKYISTTKGHIFIEIYQEGIPILEFIEKYNKIEIEIK